MKIEIKTTEDTHDCETCGWDYATGGIVYVDGDLVLEKTPIAHCYNGQSYSETDLLILALEKLGHTVLFDDELPHITMTDARDSQNETD